MILERVEVFGRILVVINKFGKLVWIIPFKKVLNWNRPISFDHFFCQMKTATD